MSSNLVKQFYLALINNRNLVAYEKGCELIIKQKHTDFWRICICVLVEWIHIFLPNGPVFLYTNFSEFYITKKKLLRRKRMLRIEHVEKIITQVVNVLATSCKQHISLYVKNQYNLQNKITKHTWTVFIREQFYQLNDTLRKMVAYKIKHKYIKSCTNRMNIQLQRIIGKILSIDCDSLNNYDNNIQLFVHTNSMIHETIIKNTFSIILTHATNLQQYSKPNIEALVKFYHSKLLFSMQKQSFIVLNIIFYFIHVYNYNYDIPPIIDEKQKKSKLKKHERLISLSSRNQTNQIKQIKNQNSLNCGNQEIKTLLMEFKKDIHECPIFSSKIYKELKLPPKTRKEKRRLAREKKIAKQILYTHLFDFDPNNATVYRNVQRLTPALYSHDNQKAENYNPNGRYKWINTDNLKKSQTTNNTVSEYEIIKMK